MSIVRRPEMRARFQLQLLLKNIKQNWMFPICKKMMNGFFAYNTLCSNHIDFNEKLDRAKLKKNVDAKLLENAIEIKKTENKIRIVVNTLQLSNFK